MAKVKKNIKFEPKIPSKTNSILTRERFYWILSSTEAPHVFTDGGIPKNDLAYAVQTSLVKRDIL